MINTILFDLDGTLLPMDTEKFTKIYMISLMTSGITCRPIRFLRDMKKCIYDTLDDTTPRTNETVFYENFGKTSKIKPQRLQKFSEKYYASKRFDKTKKATWKSAEMREAVDLLKQKGYSVMVATNPMFPELAVNKRMEWAGFTRDEFDYVTSFERSCYCKPNKEFFDQLMQDTGRTAEQCLMVGNDRAEDLAASKAGIKTYLVEDCVHHADDKEFTPDYTGNAKDFLDFCKSLPIVK